MNTDDTIDARMAVFDRRTLHLQSSINDITALLGIIVAQSDNDGPTYASIAEVETELIQDTNAFLALTCPPVTLAQLNSSLPCPPTTLTTLPNQQICRMLAGETPSLWPIEIEATNVTTRYSTGCSSLRPGMPVQYKEASEDEARAINDDESAYLGSDTKVILPEAATKSKLDAETVLSTASQHSTAKRSQHSARSRHSTRSASSWSTCPTCQNALQILTTSSARQRKDILDNNVDNAAIKTLDQEVERLFANISQLDESDPDEFIQLTGKIRDQWTDWQCLVYDIKRRSKAS
jgi:hypothetical protein